MHFIRHLDITFGYQLTRMVGCWFLVMIDMHFVFVRLRVSYFNLIFLLESVLIDVEYMEQFVNIYLYWLVMDPTQYFVGSFISLPLLQFVVFLISNSQRSSRECHVFQYLPVFARAYHDCQYQMLQYFKLFAVRMHIFQR